VALSIKTLCIVGHYGECHCAEYHYDECRLDKCCWHHASLLTTLSTSHNSQYFYFFQNKFKNWNRISQIYSRRTEHSLLERLSLISSQQSLWLDPKLENVPTVDCIVFDSTFSKKLNFSLQNFAPLSLFLFEKLFPAECRGYTAFSFTSLTLKQNKLTCSSYQLSPRQERDYLSASFYCSTGS
jgi:hypothetical protein